MQRTRPGGFRHLLVPAAALCATVALLGASPALASEYAEASGPAPHIGLQAFDLLLLRPLEVVQVVASAAVFVVAYPVGLLFDGADHVEAVCITQPVERAFRRPLGEL